MLAECLLIVCVSARVTVSVCANCVRVCVCVCDCVCGSLQKALIGQCGATAGLQISSHLLVTESLKPVHLMKDNVLGHVAFMLFTQIA